MNRKYILLLFILLLSLVLRFYHLGNLPALNADEAALGYNAYSLLQTGKDEHGNFWPIHFQSFNDYKPGLIVYMIMPLIHFFGLNEWSVRFLPALLGALTPLALYLFVKEFRLNYLKIENSKLEIASALLLALSPWHIHFSRGAWEVNIATFFMVLGSLFFLKGRNGIKYYLLSALFFILSLYTYHSARIISPLLVLGLVASSVTQVKADIRKLLVAAVFGGLLLIPLAIDFFGPAGVSRASGVSLLADSGPVSRVNEQRGQHDNTEELVTKVFHNKAINYGLAFMENWSEHYWGEFLFLSGDDIQRNKVPETGQMYIHEIVFILVGLVMIARKPRGWGFVLWWLLVAPIAAAMTFQSPHALRAQNMVIPLTIINAFGLVCIIDTVRKHIHSRIFLTTFYLLLATVILYTFSRYLLMYYGHMTKEYPYSSQYGVKELVDFVKDRTEETVVVTDRYDQPYILFLFYLNYPPEKFQAEHQLTERDVYGFSTVRQFDRYHFKTINFDEDRPQYRNSLLAGTDEEIPDEANIIKEVLFPNRVPAFQIVQN